MRTEQFLNGYNSFRREIQGILSENKELQLNEELMNLAKYSYYKDDGIDWHPDCNGCEFRKLDMDYEYYCTKKVKIQDIREYCENRKEKENPEVET